MGFFVKEHFGPKPSSARMNKTFRPKYSRMFYCVVIHVHSKKPGMDILYIHVVHVHVYTLYLYMCILYTKLQIR